MNKISLHLQADPRAGVFFNGKTMTFKSLCTKIQVQKNLRVVVLLYKWFSGLDTNSCRRGDIKNWFQMDSKEKYKNDDFFVLLISMMKFWASG